MCVSATAAASKKKQQKTLKSLNVFDIYVNIKGAHYLNGFKINAPIYEPDKPKKSNDKYLLECWFLLCEKTIFILPSIYKAKPFNYLNH